jgi:Uma2 family endonuclease
MNELTQDYNLDKKIKKEMIDGKIYLMASACDEHIDVQGNIYTIFNDYFKRNKRRCRARSDHQVYIDEKNFLEPDVKILCREKRTDDIPVIVIEVLSHSTRRRDLGIKMKKYAELGIKEYWIITWEFTLLDIYLLTEENSYDFYKTYFLNVPESELKLWDEEDKQEYAAEFSPVSFPELIIKLEDVFDIFI